MPTRGDIFGGNKVETNNEREDRLRRERLETSLGDIRSFKTGKQLRTILGRDFEHTFREKTRLRRQIAANPMAASAVFGSSDAPFFGGGSFTERLNLLQSLATKAKTGDLTDDEKKFLEQQSRFGERHGAFTRLLGRRDEVVKQREAVEAFRRRSPGRSQTILTRRES